MITNGVVLVFCVNCGVSRESDARFCQGCGTPVLADGEVPTSQPTVQSSSTMRPAHTGSVRASSRKTAVIVAICVVLALVAGGVGLSISTDDGHLDALVGEWTVEDLDNWEVRFTFLSDGSGWTYVHDKWQDRWGEEHDFDWRVSGDRFYFQFSPFQEDGSDHWEYTYFRLSRDGDLLTLHTQDDYPLVLRRTS